MLQLITLGGLAVRGDGTIGADPSGIATRKRAMPSSPSSPPRATGA